MPDSCFKPIGAIEADGTQFDEKQINNLVNAMVAFGKPVGGYIALTRDQRLRSIICWA